MADVSITFLGSGDAFGSGGRFNACFLVSAPEATFLVDCGASSMVALRRFGIEPNAIDMILVSHLHGDHFAGIPFFILDAQFISRRTAPLLLAGPPGMRRRLREAQEVLFPGSSRTQQRFEIVIHELEPARMEELAGVSVQPFLVRHECGAPPLALRFGCGGKTIAYSGDTEWCDTLVPAARGADLFITEAYYFDKQVPFHLDFRTLESHREELGAHRIVLTHMNSDMLERVESLGWEYAEDGKVIEV